MSDAAKRHAVFVACPDCGISSGRIGLHLTKAHRWRRVGGSSSVIIPPAYLPGEPRAAPPLTDAQIRDNARLQLFQLFAWALKERTLIQFALRNDEILLRVKDA